MATQLYILDDAQHATVLAALRYYQQQGLGDPFNRPDDIHDLATNGDAVLSSLDDDGIDELCESINHHGITGFQRLQDGLSDMIESGRLKQADIPDDYQWLVETLAALANGDYQEAAHGEG